MKTLKNITTVLLIAVTIVTANAAEILVKLKNGEEQTINYKK